MEELGLVFSEEKRKSGLSAAKVRVGDSGPMQEVSLSMAPWSCWNAKISMCTA